MHDPKWKTAHSKSSCGHSALAFAPLRSSLAAGFPEMVGECVDPASFKPLKCLWRRTLGYCACSLVLSWAGPGKSLTCGSCRILIHLNPPRGRKSSCSVSSLPRVFTSSPTPDSRSSHAVLWWISPLNCSLFGYRALRLGWAGSVSPVETAFARPLSKSASPSRKS